jgi:hypothetical protein
VRPIETPIEAGTTPPRRKEPYHEPLLTKHEPLLDITGVKYPEKASDNFGKQLSDSSSG